MYIQSLGSIVNVSFLSKIIGIGTYWCKLTDGKHIFSRGNSEIYKTSEEAQKAANEYNKQKYKKAEPTESLQMNNNLPFIKKK